jgi:hypothetical protein
MMWLGIEKISRSASLRTMLTQPTPSPSARRQPQVVDGETGRIDLDLANADFAEHRGSEAIELAGDDQVEQCFENAIELECEKLAQTIAGKLRGVDRALLLEDAFDLAPALRVAHHEKIPGLRETDAGRVMRGDDHAREHFVRHRVGG